MKRMKFEQEHRGITKQIVLIILFALACLVFLMHYKSIFGIIGSFFSALFPVVIGFFIALAIYPMQNSIEHYLTSVFARIAKKHAARVADKRTASSRQTPSSQRDASSHAAASNTVQSGREEPADNASATPADIGKSASRAAKHDVQSKADASGLHAFFTAAALKLGSKKRKKSEKKDTGINKGARFLSIIIAMLAVILVIVLFISVMIPQITDSYENLRDKYLDFSASVTGLMNRLNTGDENSLQNQLLDMINNFISGITSSLTDITPYVLDILKSSVSVTMDIFLGIVIAIYLLIDRERLLRICRRLLRAILPRRVVERIKENSSFIFEVYNSYITGKLIDIVIIWGLSVALLSLFRVPFAPFISIILAIMNVIPYIGIFIGLLPGFFIVLLADPGKLLFYLLAVIAIHIIDRKIIEKYVLKTTCSIDPELLIIAVVFFGGLFGTPSMFIAAPIATVINYFAKESVNRLIADRRKESGDNTESGEASGESSDSQAPSADGTSGSTVE